MEKHQPPIPGGVLVTLKIKEDTVTLNKWYIPMISFIYSFVHGNKISELEKDEKHVYNKRLTLSDLVEI